MREGNLKIYQQGVALVLVLWMLALLMVMVGGYSATMHTESLLTAHQLGAAQSRALAESGIWLAVNELLQPQSESNWRNDGTSYPVNLDAGHVQIRIFDEAGKIDLNTARVELLHALLKSAGLSDEESLHLLQAILDWRDRDNLKRQFGAEDEDYKAAGYGYGAKDGPFNSVEELRLVMGMTEPVYQKIAPALTVFSHQATVNPDVASKEVLSALSNSDEKTIDDFIKGRDDGIPGASATIEGLDSRFISRTRSRIFSISSEGSNGDSRITIEAVILKNSNATPPYSVLSWWESKPQPAKDNKDGMDGKLNDQDAPL